MKLFLFFYLDSKIKKSVLKKSCQRISFNKMLIDKPCGQNNQACLDGKMLGAKYFITFKKSE